MPRREPKTVSFPFVKATQATRRDLLVVVEGKERWVPKNVVHDDSEVWRLGDEGTLVLPEWYVEEYGWFEGEPEET